MGTPRKAKQISDTAKAVAWMLADPNRTQVDAANMFGISQSGISSMKAREDFAIHYCETVPDAVEKVYQLLEADPTRSASGLSHAVGMKASEIRLIMLGLRAKSARNEALLGIATVANSAEEMREKCAALVEMIGGEHGAAMAVAIRGLQ